MKDELGISLDKAGEEVLGVAAKVGAAPAGAGAALRLSRAPELGLRPRL